MKIGKVQPTELIQEVRKSYLDYAMSVIVARALPDVRDGLKPVHRRILYAMHLMGLGPTSSFTKSAKVVGEVLGKYHPHGDAPVYEALVRLAQDFSMRYPLISGQGNFGSVDGDPPAAMRYTEAKLAPISLFMLRDIEKDTVNLSANFDSTLTEPDYLPALLPNLLLMGAEGIAVGMATKIPPHNLTEVVDAITLAISKGRVIREEKKANEETDFFIHKIDLVASGQEERTQQEAHSELSPSEIDFESSVTIEELLEHIKGPDFPGGGAIYDANSLSEVYATGRGKILVRGIAQIKELDRGKSQILISEIPYQVNKSQLVAKIAHLVKEKKITGISDIRDESDRRGMSIVIDLRRDARPKAILNNIYKHTQLQTSFPANFVALVDGVPHTLNLKQIIVEYVKHRQKVIVRRTIFELTEAKRRAHILEGLKIALDNLDAVIRTIRRSRTQEEAKTNLTIRFKLTEIQATAILDMQLRRLAALEREKIEKEYKDIKKLIDELTSILKDPQKVLQVIKKELNELKEKHGDARRTKIYKQGLGAISEEDLVPKEEILITITKSGYIKRVARNTYKSQRRGGKGVLGMTQKEEDEIERMLSGTTHDQVLFFTDQGRVFGCRAWELPEGSRQSKGQALVNFINTDQGESVQTVLVLSGGEEEKNIIIATNKGIIKKTSIREFATIRASGLIAIRIDKGDKLVWADTSTGNDNIIILTKKGQSITFPEKNVRPMGRPTKGVRGITLSDGDEVISMEVIPPKQKPKDKRRKYFRDILTISESGRGKRTAVENFPIQKRAGKGVKSSVINNKTGDLAAAVLVTQNTQQVVITSKHGQVIKLPIKNIPRLGRATQGVILMRFTKKGDKVAAITKLEENSFAKDLEN